MIKPHFLHVPSPPSPSFNSVALIFSLVSQSVSLGTRRDLKLISEMSDFSSRTQEMHLNTSVVCRSRRTITAAFSGLASFSKYWSQPTHCVHYILGDLRLTSPTFLITMAHIYFPNYRSSLWRTDMTAHFRFIPSHLCSHTFPRRRISPLSVFNPDSRSNHHPIDYRLPA